MFDDDVVVAKSSRYSLNVTTDSKARATNASLTPRIDTFQKPSATPASAPPAAGRSPTKPKRGGLLQPRQRFAPPTFGIKSPSLSISAALNGTLAHKKAKRIRTLEESKPKSWFFDIFEESQEYQDYKMNEWSMTQSATILDISDDETKAKEAADRGKENVDPNEISMPVTRSMAAAAKATAVPVTARKDKMTDEIRSPLGDLNPADYYADGLDATSVVLVHDDGEDSTPATKDDVTDVTTRLREKEQEHEFTFGARATATTIDTRSEGVMTTAEIGALLMAATPIWDTETLVSDDQDVVPDFDSSAGTAEIEIWESESAKDENEAKEADSFKAEERIIQENIFALQEI